MPKVIKTEGNSKLVALEKYLKNRFELRQCELTGYIYIKERNKKGEKWKQLERAQTLWHQVCKSVVYQTYRGPASNYGLEYVENLLISEDVSPLYHPIKAFFESLKAPNDLFEIFDQFISCLVLEDDTPEEREFIRTAVIKWAVGAVRAVYDEKYVPKQMLLIRSVNESVGKSSFLNALTPRDLRRFRCSFKNIANTNKDALIDLSCNFIGHFEEIDQLFKNDANRMAFKSFATEESVNVRLPYGKANVYRDRITSFVGTCNNYEFMAKDVGKSRFVVINIKALVNKQYIEDNNLIGERPAEEFDVRRFWASAYALYKQGYDCYFTRREEEEIFSRNSAHQFADPLAELLLETFAPSKKEEDGEFLGTLEIRKALQNVDENVYITPATMGRTLTSSGFKKVRHRDGSKRKWGYWVKRLEKVEDISWTDPTPKKENKTVKLL